MAQQQWKGPERRQSLGPYTGEDRRRRAGYRDDAGVNAEEPKTEQDQAELHRRAGPNPQRKPERKDEPDERLRRQRDQTDIH